VSSIPASKYTHIIAFSFVDFSTTTGAVSLADSSYATTIQQLMGLKSQNPSLKVLVLLFPSFLSFFLLSFFFSLFSSTFFPPSLFSFSSFPPSPPLVPTAAVPLPSQLVGLGSLLFLFSISLLALFIFLKSLLPLL
jgi:hypothetical protein